MVQTAVLTFEDFASSRPVGSVNAGGDFPNGRFIFDNNALSLLNQTAGGDGNFTNPNRVVASFDSPTVIITLEGFNQIASGELRFRYTSPFTENNRVILRDANNQILVNRTLPRTDLSLSYNITPATNPIFTVPFTGNVKTIELGGVQREFGIDDIQIANVVFVANRPPIITLAQSSFTIGQGQTIQIPTITVTDDRGIASLRIETAGGTLTAANDVNPAPGVVVLEGLRGTSLSFSNISYTTPIVLTNAALKIIATDNEGLSSEVSLPFTVQATPRNALPEFRNLPTSPISVLPGQVQPFSFSIFDQDSDRAFLILNAPEGVTLNVPGDTNPAPNRVELNNRPISEINEALQRSTFSSTRTGKIGVDLFLDDLSADRSDRPVSKQPGIIFDVRSSAPIVRGLERLTAPVGTASPLGITIEDDSAELTVILTNIPDLSNPVAPPVALTVPASAPLRDRDGVANNNYVDLRGTVAQINETLRQITATGFTPENSTLFITVQDESNTVREQKELRFNPLEIPVVSIRTNNNRIKEPIGSESITPGEFIISRTGSTTQPLSVGVSLSGIGGNATRGADFRLEPDVIDRVTIPAGASSVTIRVIPLADDLVEGEESINFSLLPGAGFNLGNSNASITIEDTPPVVTVKATDPNAQEGGLGFNPDPGRFTISRTGLTTRDLPVSFTLTGTATIGEDYQSIPLSVTIPAGRSNVDVEIVPRADNLVEGDETVILTLTENRERFILGADKSDTVTIADRRPGIASVIATQSVAARPPIENRVGIFAIIRPVRADGVQDTTGDFIVDFTIGGTATFGQDYEVIPSNTTGFSLTGNRGRIVIRDARSSETITIVPKADNDNIPEDETVTLAIVNGNAATVTITENRPIVTVEAIDPTAKEPLIDGFRDVIVNQNQVSVRFRDNAVQDGDRIRVALNGVVIDNDLLLTNAGTSITLNLLPGVNILEITALNQGADPPDAALNTAEVSIGNEIQTSRGLRTGETVVLNIINTSPTANPNAVTAGRGEFAGVFRIKREGNNSQDLLVTYNITGTATNGVDYVRLDNRVVIPAGQNFVDVIVSPLADNQLESVETVILTITSTTAYTIGTPNTATVTIEDSTVLINAVNDTIQGVAAGNVLIGTSGNDTLIGSTATQPIVIPFSQLLANDSPAGNVRIISVSSGTGGTAVLDIENQTVIFTPSSLASGSFSYTIAPIGQSAPTSTATVTVIPGSGVFNVIRGLAGNDSLVGTSGSDTLDGGDGKDTLVGGAGADVFQINRSEGDVITDFSLSDNDRIELLANNYSGGIGTLLSLEVASAIDLAFNSSLSLSSLFAPGLNSPAGTKPTYAYDDVSGRLLLDRDGSNSTNTFELIAQLPSNLNSFLFEKISIVSSFSS